MWKSELTDYENLYRKHIKAFGGRPEFINCTIEKSIIDKSNQDPYQDFLNCNFDSQKGAYVYGNPGSGKSHILKIKYNLAYEKKLKAIVERLPDFRYPYWIETSEYLEGLRPGAPRPTMLKQDAFEAHWLFIDDLGATTKTEWAVDQIFQLIDSRLRNKRQTFISSNFNVTELQDFYGERISSRVHELCQIIKLVGYDKRKIQ